MASTYPGTLDSFSTAHVTGDVIAAATDNDQADAINKIEAELGTTPSAAYSTVAARLDDMPVQLYDETLVSAGTFDVSSISGSFAHLMVMLNARCDTGTSSRALLLRFNNDSGGNYDTHYVQLNNTTVSGARAAAGTSITAALAVGADATANMYASARIDVLDYANTTRHKEVEFHASAFSSTGAQGFVRTGGGQWRSTSAITRIQILEGTVNLTAGSRITIYGLA